MNHLKRVEALKLHDKTSTVLVDWSKSRMEANKNNAVSLGFLTVRKHAVHGYFGGLLILNHLARPLEFHCTLPLQTTKAQQILYGSTLDEFVCGEQIGRALLLKAKSSPQIVLTDTLASLALRHVHAQAIAAIDGAWEKSDAMLTHPEVERTDYATKRVASLSLSVLPEYASDLQKIETLFEQLDLNMNFMEPFGRIEDALREAHPATKAA